ncbi:MAG: CBS domain-containing protein [bacterium]|nr:CBS domain-containing protein [bacterium]MCP5044683.1 CBS domain-containing protein [bacterium]
MPRRIQISEVMTPDVVTVEVSSPMSQVRKILLHEKFHHLPVVDGERLVGIISTNDLIRIMQKLPVANEDDLNDTLDGATSVKETMQTDLITMRADETVERAIDLLADGDLHSLLVVDKDEALAGIVTNIDLLEYLFA